MEAIGPGTPLICVKYWHPIPGRGPQECANLTVDAMYFCESVGISPVGTCPWDGCGDRYVTLRDRFCDCFNMSIPYCPNLFRPLNDGNTSFIPDKAKEPSLV